MIPHFIHIQIQYSTVQMICQSTKLKKGRITEDFVEENISLFPVADAKKGTPWRPLRDTYSLRIHSSLRYILSPAPQEEKKSMRISWMVPDQ